MRASILAFSVAFAALALASGAPLRKIRDIDCSAHRSVDLVVKETRVNVDGVIEFNTRAYHYNGKPYLPGPTIHFTPGRKCTIKIVNQLSDGGNATCLAAMDGGDMNMLHCPDVTNLHTHGTQTFK